MVNFCNSDGWPSGTTKSTLIQLATSSKLECVAPEILQQSSKFFYQMRESSPLCMVGSRKYYDLVFSFLMSGVALIKAV